MERFINQQYISRLELNEAGYSNYKIKQLVDAGRLASLNGHFFENLEFQGETNDFYAVKAYTKNGVVCLMSAAVYYGLSTYIPRQIDVAIPRWNRMPQSTAMMQFYFFSKNRYDMGIDHIVEGDNLFDIYDIEKTVCDVFFYRNKLGFETALEVIKTYLSHSERNLNKLMGYAEKLRCGNQLREYLEVLV